MTSPDREHQAPPTDEPERWLDKPGSVGLIIKGLTLVCVLVVAADLLYHKHGHYSFEKWPGFHAIYGFISCVLLVLAATQMRRLVMRDEDYYD
ncbi:MAG: hypothetical protein VX913_03250 [Planctomycetota bacterium]|nr:hypothetical protein [Planctomycetota bacterium]